MGLPDPKQFNFKLLLQRLQREYGEGMTKELLAQLLHDKDIKGDPIPETVLRGGGISWEREYGAGGYILDAGIKRKPVVRVPTGRIADWTVSRDEVLRFIAENPPTSATPEAAANEPEAHEMLPDEKPADFVIRRRCQGIIDKEIGWELSRQGFSKEMIGRAFFPDIEYHPTNYTKKADKILGLK